MYGDEHRESGGHLHGLGHPSKREFPAEWDEDKIADNVVSVARDPSAVHQRMNGTWRAVGTRDGVLIGVYVRPNGTIATGFPIEGPGVRRNPRRRV